MIGGRRDAPFLIYRLTALSFMPPQVSNKNVSFFAWTELLLLVLICCCASSLLLLSSTTG